MASRYFCFEPEVVVEVTIVCNWSCHGCYAPNVISRTSHEIALNRHPEWFLNPITLINKLTDVTRSAGRLLQSLAFRGGEPTCHPNLPELIKVGLRHAHFLFIETHARWALLDARNAIDISGVLKALNNPNVTVKVSFDSMHRISSEELKNILAVFNDNNVNWLVAITEPDHAALLKQRDRCNWIPDSKIVLQPKALNRDGLYSPPLGVIRTMGDFAHSLSTRSSF